MESFYLSTFIFIILVFATTSIAGASFNFQKFIDLDNPDAVEFSTLVNKLKFAFKDEKDVKKRLKNFEKAKNEIDDLRKKYKGAKFGHNKFSLMSMEERKRYLGSPKLEDRPAVNFATPLDSNNSLRSKRGALSNVIETTPPPTSYDFRAYGKVTSVKDQGDCGSCYAFAGTAAVESQYLLRYNLSLDLSEQSLVSCRGEGMYGCGGGWLDQTFDSLIINGGIPTESCYPYVAYEDWCYTGCNLQKYPIAGYHKWGSDESEYAKNLYNYGPSPFYFIAPNALWYYVSGVMDEPYDQCMNYYNNGAHETLIVGYTPTEWIAKNSWGSWWGEAGYFRFKRGQNFCGMTIQVVTPYLNNTNLAIGTTTTTTTTPKTTTTTTTTKAPTTTTTTSSGTTTTTTNKPSSTSTTTTQKPTSITTMPQEINKCSGALDLVFVINGSDTMTASRFNTIKSQLVSVVTDNGIQWGNNKAHVGIVLSGGLTAGGPSAPYRYLDLNGCQNNTSNSCTPTVNSTLTLITAFQNMPFLGGKNNIALAMMETVTGSGYWGSAGDRADVRNVMFVLTGNDTSNVGPARDALLAQGVKIYSVGLDGVVSSAQLEAISGSYYNSFGTVPDNLASLIKLICESAAF